MSSKAYHLTYRGELRGLDAHGQTISFVTAHVEQKPSSLYQIDGQTNKLTTTELDFVASSMLRVDDQIWIAGEDGSLHQFDEKSKKAKQHKIEFPSPATAMCQLSDSRIGIVADQQLVIVSCSGKVKAAQTIELESAATAIASNPDGNWLAVGTSDGQVAVYQAEESEEFELSESAQLHEGAVRSLVFEPEELRFFSCGDDHKLLLTHARGRLEPEDRGRGNNHGDQVFAMVLAGDDRIITGSRDKTCKSWARAGATKPQTQAKDLVVVTHLAIAEIHKRRNLVVGCGDNSLRLFLLKDDERIGDLLWRYDDLYTRCESMLQTRDPAVRGQAMQELAEFDDRRCAQWLAKQIADDSDNKLRLTAAKLLAKSQHSQLAELLQPHLAHQDAPVREFVLQELAKLQPDDLVELYESAINIGMVDIGVTSVDSLVKVAKDKKRSDAQRNHAQGVLVRSMDSGTVEIRNAAILGLEQLFDKNSSRPNLLTLESTHADSKRKGLIRLFQRNLLDDENVSAGLRRAVEDSDPDVRQTGFLVSVLSRDKLAKSLRERDKDLDRKLSELEKFDFDASAKKATKKKSAAKSSKAAKPAKRKLDAEDYDPLLIAISSRAVDTCLSGARCLALLEDPRAFGLLLQLSREHDADIRLETCRSFERLGDQRATDRLCAMLEDEEAKVRDAAFTALGKICAQADVPLDAASQAMAVQHEDVRMRGLEQLIRFANKSKTNLKNADVRKLLTQALNDSQAVRSEAFKFALNAKYDGGDDATLRFALGSVHEDVRRDVLNEIIAEEKQPWASVLIREMLNDPELSIRTEAFEYLQKKTKDADQAERVEWLSNAIAGQYEDMRLAACKELTKLDAPEAQTVLADAINDDSIHVRQFALANLVRRNSIDGLVAAMESDHVGVKIAAARALARQGDSRSRPTLEQFANAEMPEVAEAGEEHQKLWQDLTTSAIGGLAELEDPETVPLFVEKAAHVNDAVRHEAARALRWATTPETVELLQPLLRHEDETVKLYAAYACAIHGDVLAGRMVLGSTADWIESSERLKVAVALGDETENQLIQQLDLNSEILIPNSALLILLARDSLDHNGSPRRIVAAMAARDARLRLIAASALQVFGDRKLLGELVIDVFNNRADDKPFEIEADVVKAVVSVLVFGKSPLRCRVISLLEKLSEAKQDDWNIGWNRLSHRYADEIKAALKAAKDRKLAKVETDQETLDQLAFGAYVGLAREQGGFQTWPNYPRFGWQFQNVRQASLRRLQSMAEANKSFHGSAVSVITHTCGDPVQSIRQKAFEALKELGVDDRQRAEIGINCGNLDLAIEGLGLLTSSAKKDERKEILSRAIFNQPANVAIEAAKLLREEVGSVATCETCLESSQPKVAIASVDWLAEDYEDKAAAKKLLQKLAKDSPLHVQTRAIEALVKRKDDAAFEAITAVASETNPKIDRKKCYRWFSQLGDPRTSEFLLELFENQDLDLNSRELLQVVGEFRDPAAAPRLLELMSQKELASDAASTVYKISGFDQQILDPQDAWPDRLWIDSQHPRHGDVLANLMLRSQELSLPKLTGSYIAGARWCLTSEVDQPLERLVLHPEDQLRHKAIEAISFRAEKRDGSVESLKPVVEHRDPTTQFLAAEGLAKAGEADGLQVLMSAVELMDDLRMRRRAVLALGHLADERALDQLLNLVTHDAHALQDCAAEAIGRLGSSEHREKILKILLTLVARQGTAGERALIGLRHMNVPEGWDKIRAEASSSNASSMRHTARYQLGFDSADATRDLLLKLLEMPNNNPAVLLASARRCFGMDSIESDLAYLKGMHQNLYQLGDLELECLARVCEKATPDQIFDLVDCCPAQARTRLVNHVLSMEPLPIKEATLAVAGTDPRTVDLAAHVIGRHADSKSSKACAAAFEYWLTEYSKASEQLKLQNEAADSEVLEQASVLKRLIWSLGRVGGAKKELLELLVSHQPDDHFRELRHAAMDALDNEKLTATDAKQLPDLLQDYDPRIRAGAGALLLAHKESNQPVVAEALLADRRPFDRMASDKKFKASEAFKSAVNSAHYQPRTLPHLIAEKDFKTLASVANNDKLDLPSRLGAIEGLAKIIDKGAEKALIAIGNDESLDQGLRKAAWRGLRRSKRTKKELAK